jgi:replicative superfamily II helicase
MAPTDSEKDDHEVGQYFDGLDDNDFLALVVESEDANESGKRRLEDGADVGPPRKKPHQDDTEPTTPSKPTRREYLQLARRVLQERFGFEKFREEQERAIVNILSGKNTLVIFPSGAGKSLCYQIPAFAFPDIDAMDGSDDRRGGSGISIVVSPLTALMKDQVDALRKRGIKAECIDSTKTRQEQLLITQLMKDGQLRLLYCTPERLNNETFVSRVKDIPGGVRLVAVDEAHCVSEVRIHTYSWCANELRPRLLMVLYSGGTLSARITLKVRTSVMFFPSRTNLRL